MPARRTRRLRLEPVGPGRVEGRRGVHDDAPFALYAGVPGG